MRCFPFWTGKKSPIARLPFEEPPTPLERGCLFSIDFRELSFSLKTFETHWKPMFSLNNLGE